MVVRVLSMPGVPFVCLVIAFGLVSVSIVMPIVRVDLAGML